MLEIDAIQELCRKVVEESDPEQARRLIAQLRETIAVDSGETRLRIGLMAPLLKNR